MTRVACLLHNLRPFSALLIVSMLLVDDVCTQPTNTDLLRSQPPSVAESETSAPAKPQSASQSEDTPSAPVVLQVTHDLIDEIARDTIEATVPVQTRIAGGSVHAVVHGRADLTAEMKAEAEKARFIVRGHGTATARFTGTRGPIKVSGNIRAAFSVSKEVTFDGHFFKAGRTCVGVRLTSCVSRIEGARNDPFSGLIAHAASVFESKIRSEINRLALPKARQYVAEFTNEEADRIVSILNEAHPIEEAVLEAFPEQRNWTTRLSTTPRYVQAVYGPKGSTNPILPDEEIPDSISGMLLWLQLSVEEARFVKLLADTKVVHNLLKEELSEDDRELREVIDEIRVEAIDDWVLLHIVEQVDQDETPPSPEP